MTRRSTAARRGGVLVALALAGLGGACTTVRDSAYDTAYAPPPSGYGYGGYAAPYGYAAAPRGYGVPDYVAAARAGDSYCQEATAAVRQSRAEAAYTGSPEAASRLARTRSYASRDC
jgi:hypothetical protein